MKRPQRFIATLLVLLLILAGCSKPVFKPVPEVLSVTPADGAVNVPAGTPVTAKFNVALVPAELKEAFSLSAAGISIPGQVVYDEAVNTLVFVPTEPLPAGELITASIDTTAISIHKKPFGKAVEWSFTTEAEPVEPTPEPDPEPEPEPVPVPTLTITSHTDGQTITGSRNIAITAELQDALPDATITVELNGITNSFTRTGDTIEAAIELTNNDNQVTITVENNGQPPASQAINLNYPYITLTDFQLASVVIGQPDFTTTNEADNQKSFRFSAHRPAIHNGVLYLTDPNRNRVMGYNTIPTENNASADFVIGQPDFNSFDSGTSRTRFNYPVSLLIAGNNLIVSDFSNNRLLIWDEAPTTTGTPADQVIGQTSMSDSSPGCTSTSLDGPQASTIVDGKLIVPESRNHRVLIWNDYTTAPDQPADLVIGQPNFTTCDPDTSQADLRWPTSTWSDGNKLIVTDLHNNRVLIWNTFPTQDHQAADVVLGQSTFDTGYYGVGPAALNVPFSVHSNGNQLFIADTYNHRVLIWNEIPTSNTPADIVLGQPHMNSRDANAPMGSTNQQGLNEPHGVYAHGNQLFVPDRYNNRYLIFEGINP